MLPPPAPNVVAGWAKALICARKERDALKAERAKDHEAMLGAGFACKQAHEENATLKAEVERLKGLRSTHEDATTIDQLHREVGGLKAEDKRLIAVSFVDSIVLRRLGE